MCISTKFLGLNEGKQNQQIRRISRQSKKEYEYSCIIFMNKMKYRWRIEMPIPIGCRTDQLDVSSALLPGDAKSGTDEITASCAADGIPSSKTQRLPAASVSRRWVDECCPPSPRITRDTPRGSMHTSPAGARIDHEIAHEVCSHPFSTARDPLVARLRPLQQMNRELRLPVNDRPSGAGPIVKSHSPPPRRPSTSSQPQRRATSNGV
jgi:hypothetical protein